MWPTSFQIGPAVFSVAAIASCPERAVSSTGIHCTAAVACSSVTLSVARSADCQATISVSGPIRRRARAQLVQKEQSPS